MSAAAVILAAGQGTRFRSELAKVLHPVAGRTLLRWVLEAIRPLGLERVVVVVGHQADDVRAEAERAGIGGLVTVVQERQRGTGHAVGRAVEAGALGDCARVLVLPGDVPVLRPELLRELLDAHRDGAAATLLTARLDDPRGYGRVLRDGAGAVSGVVEERDASDEQRSVREVCTSVYVFDRDALAGGLSRLGSDNAQGEEYLTDVVGLLAPAGVGALGGPAEALFGVNDRAQLAAAGAVLRGRMLERLMRAGVTVVDPASTYVEADVEVEADAVLLPGTHLEGATRVAARASVGPDSRLVDATVEQGATVTYSVVLGAHVGPGATVGPFTYLRPGTRLDRDSKAGAFVEMKAATVGAGSKVPHLSYIGDSIIGEDVNVGAATVTVNYDGHDKHRTVIGDGARVGSDTMLVAPVRIGAGAYTGAGSVITRDVPDGALAVERGEQRIVPDYAERKARQRAARDPSPQSHRPA